MATASEGLLREAATKNSRSHGRFWIIKIAATTLGETGGDSVTMTLNWGYFTGILIFLPALVLLVVAQIIAGRFHPFHSGLVAPARW